MTYMWACVLLAGRVVFLLVSPQTRLLADDHPSLPGLDVCLREGGSITTRSLYHKALQVGFASGSERF